MILIAAGEWERACIIGGALRTEIAKRTGILDAVIGTFSFLWITEFPLLEFSSEENRYIARHHPFTAPMNEDVHLLDSAPEKLEQKHMIWLSMDMKLLVEVFVYIKMLFNKECSIY